LYFDTRLSADNTVSCASCHHPQEGFSRHTATGVGIEGQKGGRNSPVSYNRILSDKQFWDGRADSLEAQAVGPIQNPIEMGNTHAAAVATLKSIPGYVAQFQ
ncbi:MAG: cytochrome-c peroxidase, partial [Phycisphaerae bacterium]